MAYFMPGGLGAFDPAAATTYNARASRELRWGVRPGAEWIYPEGPGDEGLARDVYGYQDWAKGDAGPSDGKLGPNTMASMERTVNAWLASGAPSGTQASMWAERLTLPGAPVPEAVLTPDYGPSPAPDGGGLNLVMERRAVLAPDSPSAPSRVPGARAPAKAQAGLWLLGAGVALGLVLLLAKKG